VKIDSQIVAVTAAQGALAIERRMLDEAFVGPPAPTSSPGVNATKRLALAGGGVVFHKPFAGVPAAFFDALIAQQDRHDGNWRWDATTGSTPTWRSSIPRPRSGSRGPKARSAGHVCSPSPTAAETSTSRSLR
jgi:hypothetical protein